MAAESNLERARAHASDAMNPFMLGVYDLMLAEKRGKPAVVVDEVRAPNPQVMRFPTAGLGIVTAINKAIQAVDATLPSEEGAKATAETRARAVAVRCRRLAVYGRMRIAGSPVESGVWRMGVTTAPADGPEKDLLDPRYFHPFNSRQAPKFFLPPEKRTGVGAGTGGRKKKGAAAGAGAQETETGPMSRLQTMAYTAEPPTVTMTVSTGPDTTESFPMLAVDATLLVGRWAESQQSKSTLGTGAPDGGAAATPGAGAGAGAASHLDPKDEAVASAEGEILQRRRRLAASALVAAVRQGRPEVRLHDATRDGAISEADLARLSFFPDGFEVRMVELMNSRTHGFKKAWSTVDLVHMFMIRLMPLEYSFEAYMRWAILAQPALRTETIETVLQQWRTDPNGENRGVTRIIVDTLAATAFCTILQTVAPALFDRGRAFLSALACAERVLRERHGHAAEDMHCALTGLPLDKGQNVVMYDVLVRPAVAATLECTVVTLTVGPTCRADQLAGDADLEEGEILPAPAPAPAKLTTPVPAPAPAPTKPTTPVPAPAPAPTKLPVPAPAPAPAPPKSAAVPKPAPATPVPVPAPPSNKPAKAGTKSTAAAAAPKPAPPADLEPGELDLMDLVTPSAAPVPAPPPPPPLEWWTHEQVFPGRVVRASDVQSMLANARAHLTTLVPQGETAVQQARQLLRCDTKKRVAEWVTQGGTDRDRRDGLATLGVLATDHFLTFEEAGVDPAAASAPAVSPPVDEVDLMDMLDEPAPARPTGVGPCMVPEPADYAALRMLLDMGTRMPADRRNALGFGEVDRLMTKWVAAGTVALLEGLRPAVRM